MWGTILGLGGKAMSNVTSNWKLYVIGVLLAFITVGALYFGSKLLAKEERISTLNAENAKLLADTQILKGNIATIKITLDETKKDVLFYKEMNDIATREALGLREELELANKRAGEFNKALAKFREDSESDEAKLLEIPIPDSIVDAWNNDGGMFNDPESDLPSTP